MAGLKELRTRIETIKSTEKITSAMKMVAAARLRRSQGLIEKCRFYNNNILASANRVLFELRQEEQKKNVRFVYPELMRGSGKAELSAAGLYFRPRPLRQLQFQCGARSLKAD